MKNSWNSFGEKLVTNYRGDLIGPFPTKGRGSKSQLALWLVAMTLCCLSNTTTYQYQPNSWMVYCFILKSTDCLVMRNSEKYIQQPYIVSPHSPLSIQVLNGIMHHTKAKCLSRHGINVCLFKEAIQLCETIIFIYATSDELTIYARTSQHQTCCVWITLYAHR